MDAFDFVQPSELSEALRLLSDKGAVAHAGGVDLLDRIKERIDTPSRLVNLRKIPELSSRIEDRGKDGVTIGAMTTLAELAASPVLRSRYRALADAADHAATPNVRNMATIGGNLAQRSRCWYFRSADFVCSKKGGDTCFAIQGENAFHAIMNNNICAAVHPSTPATALLAFDAEILIAGAKEARSVPVSKFFVRPEEDVKRENILAAGELITGVKLPAFNERTKSAYIKQGQRESYDWPIADVAVRLELEGGQVKDSCVILGSAAPVPIRAVGVDAVLRAKKLDAQVAAAAGKAAMVGAKPLGKNGYKVEVFEAVVARAILAAAEVAS